MKKILPLVATLLLLGACQNAPVEEQAHEQTPPAPTVARFQTMGYTNTSPDGNKYVEGTGNFPRPPMEVALGATPTWLVGTAVPGGSIWVALLEDGTAKAFDVSDGTAFPGEIAPAALPAGMPPALAVSARGQAQLLTAEGASQLSCPVVTGPDAMAWISENGDLVLRNGGDRSSLPVHALPDARILSDGNGRLLVLADTASFHHAVLGDALEARSFVIVETQPVLKEVQRVTLREVQVFEGIYPIWIDIDGDGSREIIATVSNNPDGEGARLVVFEEDGTMQARGNLSPPGWRHQLAVVPGPEGRQYIVDVQRPHVDKIVEFYYLEGDTLLKAAEAQGYSSHIASLRNLDMAIAGDFDGDGVVETVLPSADHTQLRAVVLEGSGVKEVWSLDLGSEIATNIAAVSFGDGRLGLGVGKVDGRMRLWLP